MRGPASQRKGVATFQEQEGLPESQDRVHYFHYGHCRHHPTGHKHPAQPGTTMGTLGLRGRYSTTFWKAMSRWAFTLWCPG